MANNCQLQVCVMPNSGATAPLRAYGASSAGYDLCASEDLDLAPRTRDRVLTGLQISMPEGVYGKIAGRSGLACHGIDVHSGTIDGGYTGQLMIIVINNTNSVYNIKRGDRIAQLLLVPCVKSDLVLVNQDQLANRTLIENTRQDQGFGSSGF